MGQQVDPEVFYKLKPAAKWSPYNGWWVSNAEADGERDIIYDSKNATISGEICVILPILSL